MTSGQVWTSTANRPIRKSLKAGWAHDWTAVARLACRHDVRVPIAFEGTARALSVLHALAAVVLTGAVTHVAVFHVLARRRGRPGYLRRAERLWPVLAIALIATTLLGLVTYPTYRIHTRARYLDLHHPTAVWAFEVKEDVAALVFVLIAGAWLLRRPAAVHPGTRLLQGAFVGLGAALCWTTTVAGLIVTLHRGIGP